MTLSYALIPNFEKAMDTLRSEWKFYPGQQSKIQDFIEQCLRSPHYVHDTMMACFRWGALTNDDTRMQIYKELVDIMFSAQVENEKKLKIIQDILE